MSAGRKTGEHDQLELPSNEQTRGGCFHFRSVLRTIQKKRKEIKSGTFLI